MTTYKKVEYDNTPVLVARAEVAGNAETAVSATSAGTCTGNSATATALANARNINIQDADGSHTGTAAAFDGTAAATIKLPATIKATLVGNADTATSATSAASAAEATHATSADSATTATKIGSTSVGGTAKPVYINAGVPTAIGTGTAIGGATTPVYLASDGTITAGTALKGAAYVDTVSTLGQDSGNVPTATAVRGFVNSSIATATATFKGTLNVVTDLGLTVSATHAQIEAALNAHTFTPAPDANDYCFVYIPTGSGTADRYERYKYATAWEYEYTLNASGFTQAQWDAINSGADATAISTLNTYISGTAKVPKAVAADSATSADSATTAGTADKVGSATVGSATAPVYIASGVPTACGSSLDVSITGNAQTATSAGSATSATTATKLGSTDVGSASTPIYLDDGAPVACTSITANSVPYTGITSNPWSVTDVVI